MTRKAPPNPAPRDLALSVTYLVRLMVPPGSELSVRAEGADGASSVKTIETAGGPPYALELPVSGDKSAYPMTVNATLNSLVGHTLTGAVTLDAPPGDAPVEIVLAPASE
ncbi:hypothetical protein D6850_11540 [Roseovarius spongiae]|uniref:Uncharacterized protein n=1 Tax=Roseovarius spongiae TaxID=2320272 RepID=A0A3A8ARZ8_9RHOB|nr:hypothetical protein [Roseovarius spongiae]RKF13827.1 hypothetical protein D6850_11540 [Roseovarius spongiae]